MLGGVYFALASARFARLAAVVAGVALAVCVAGLAQISNAGLDPARALASDVVADVYPSPSIYLCAPFVGGAAAAVTVLATRRSSRTGKLRHDPAITCSMHCSLPHAASTVAHTEAD
jgi:hypothetical protein